jgi:hypothetical protein
MEGQDFQIGGHAAAPSIAPFALARWRCANASGCLAHKRRGNRLPHHQQHFLVEAVGPCHKLFQIVVFNDVAVSDDAHPLFLKVHPLSQQPVPPLRHFAFVPQIRLCRVSTQKNEIIAVDSGRPAGDGTRHQVLGYGRAGNGLRHASGVTDGETISRRLNWANRLTQDSDVFTRASRVTIRG